MRTTIVLDDALVKRAREVLGGPSLRAMIEESLRQSIRARGREKFKKVLREGMPGYDVTDEELALWRKDRTFGD